MASRQGGHQVAQKSRSTTFPFREVRVISRFSKDLSEKFGAKADSFTPLPHWRRNARASPRQKSANSFKRDSFIWKKTRIRDTGRNARRDAFDSLQMMPAPARRRQEGTPDSLFL